MGSEAEVAEINCSAKVSIRAELRRARIHPAGHLHLGHFQVRELWRSTVALCTVGRFAAHLCQNVQRIVTGRGETAVAQKVTHGNQVARVEAYPGWELHLWHLGHLHLGDLEPARSWLLLGLDGRRIAST